jgi:lanosterol synthase
MSFAHPFSRIAAETPYRQTIRDAIDYLHKAQKPGGGWVGSWGICFTYATQFALESLSLVGETYDNSEHSQRACKFLLGKQRQDGGWGESYKVSDLLQCMTLADL